MLNPTPIGTEPVIVATDLDGTLLDHHDYSWQAAAPALQALKEAEVPIIINTSKTFEEVLELQKALGIVEPFIVENGSGLFLPVNTYPQPDTRSEQVAGFWQCTLGSDREAIVARLHELREANGWQFSGFADMTLTDLIQHTGLPEESARKAMKRRFSEPLVWKDTDAAFAEFKAQLEAEGYRILKGGRFVHVLGDTDKGSAVTRFADIFATNGETFPKIIALGDSPNDIEMLQVADYAVLVRSPVQNFPEFNSKGVQIRTSAFGPEGWNEAIQSLLQH